MTGVEWIKVLLTEVRKPKEAGLGSFSVFLFRHTTCEPLIRYVRRDIGESLESDSQGID